MTIKYDKRSILEECITNVTCDNCGIQLEKVFEDNKVDYWKNLQPKNALELRLIGGYGMYFDQLNGPTPPVIFCKECTDKLIKLFPCLKQAMV